MDIDAKQLKGKPRKIGELKGDPVFQAETKGGLFLLMTKAGGKPRTIGAGSHPAIARRTAEKEHPDFRYTELSKSEGDDHLDIWSLRRGMEAAMSILRRIQSLE